MTFTKPKLEVVHVKIAIMGLPWSGKSYSSLLLARGLVGEAGREAVMPLQNNTGWMDGLAEKLASKLSGPREGEGTGGTAHIPHHIGIGVEMEAQGTAQPPAIACQQDRQREVLHVAVLACP